MVRIDFLELKIACTDATTFGFWSDEKREKVNCYSWNPEVIVSAPRTIGNSPVIQFRFASTESSGKMHSTSISLENAKCIYVSIARKMHSWAVLQKTYQQPRKSMTLADLLLGMRSKWLSPTLWQVEPTNESLEVEKGNHSCQPRWWAWIPDINVPIFACSQTRNNEIR